MDPALTPRVPGVRPAGPRLVAFRVGQVVGSRPRARQMDRDGQDAILRHTSAQGHHV